MSWVASEQAMLFDREVFCRRLHCIDRIGIVGMFYLGCVSINTCEVSCTPNPECEVNGIECYGS